MTMNEHCNPKFVQCYVSSRSHQQVTQFSWFILPHTGTMFHDSYFTQRLHQSPLLLKVQIKCKEQTVVFGQTEVFVMVDDRYILITR